MITVRRLANKLVRAVRDEIETANLHIRRLWTARGRAGRSAVMQTMTLRLSRISCRPSRYPVANPATGALAGVR
jgi:hypothetical protein